MKVLVLAAVFGLFNTFTAKLIVSQRYRNKLRKHINVTNEFQSDGSGSEDICEKIVCGLNLTKELDSLDSLIRICLDVVEFDDRCQPKFVQLTTPGVYPLQHQRMVYYDMDSDGGVWLVIQRRTKISGD